MKRVLHLVNSLDMGGIEVFIMNIYRNINKEKIQFDFLVVTNNNGIHHFENEIISLGGKIYKIPGKRPNYFKHLAGLTNFFKNNKQYDTIHQHTNGHNDVIPNLIIAKKSGVKKIIYHSHSSKSNKVFINTIFNIIFKPHIKNIATHYFACSDLAAKHLFGRFIKQDKIEIIKNAINTEKFIYNENIRNLKRKEFKIENKFVIGHIGRFAEVKNHSFIIDIFAEIYKKNPESILLLIGDGNLRCSIENKIKQMGLQNNVILAGTRTDIPDLLQAMDVFLFPSLYEGFPVTLVEAQASGLPCIISDSITKQVFITNLVEYISLDKPNVYWAERLLELNDGHLRENMLDDIYKAGYDIKNLVEYLSKIYLNTNSVGI